MFDELKILITGDTSGIKSSVKQAINIVQGGVKQMNAQEVDWTGIFSRAVSPAIISGVASVFAFAISQAMDFQTAMNQTGTAAGDSASQIAQLSQSALNLSTQVPQGAQDIANAMVQVSTVFGKNTQATSDITQAMGELATVFGVNLNDVVSASIGLFKQWGVTTEDQAIQVLTSLMHSAQGAQEPITTLAQQFLDFSNQLPATVKNVGSFNSTVAAFGAEVKDLGSAGAEQIFSALAKAAQGAAPEMKAIGLSMASVTKSLLSDGGLSAIQQATDAIGRLGPNAVLVAQGMGLSAQQIVQFQTNAAHLPQVAIDAKDIATNTQTIQQAYDQSASSLRNLSLLWNHFLADAINVGGIFSPLVGAFAGALNTMLGDADGFFKNLTDGLGSVIYDFGSGKLGSAFKDAINTAGGAIHDLIVTPAAQVGAALANATGTVNAGALNSNLSATGLNFDSGTLGRLDKSASESGMVGSLINALQTGIKSGQYTQLVNTFHLTVPAGSQGLTAKMIAQQLYNQFQGTQ